MSKDLRKHKSKLLIGILLLITTIGIAVWGFSDEILYWAQKPKGIFESKFLYQEIFFECSRPIKGKWTEARTGFVGGKGYYFVPENKSDLDKFCRTNGVIEYKSVIDILKKEDIGKLIDKYDTAEAWVKALSHKYINDKDYLKRILPAYRNMKIDCIIVVHSPEGTRFFIENGEVHASHNDHQYIEIEAEEFLGSLNKAFDEDVTNFWLGLH